MGELVKLFVLLGVLFAFLGLLWLVAHRMGWLAAAKDGAGEGKAAAAKYKVRPGVLSDGERAVLPVLREAASRVARERGAPEPLLLASVRLAEVLEVDVLGGTGGKGGRAVNGSAWRSAFNAIQAKQVDFVLCEPERTRPLLVIELDDATHERADRARRDRAVEAACASAGLPVLRVRAVGPGGRYDAGKLAAEMSGLIPRR